MRRMFWLDRLVRGRLAGELSMCKHALSLSGILGPESCEAWVLFVSLGDRPETDHSAMGLTTCTHTTSFLHLESQPHPILYLSFSLTVG